MQRVAILRDPLFLLHSNGPGHPESAARLTALEAMLQGFAFRHELEELPARDAAFEELARVHAPEYIRRIEATSRQDRTVLDPDTSANRDSYAAARRAAGGAIAAAEAVLDRPLGGSFAFLRPPGHHAEADRAMGFCLFNNVAVAAAHALEARGLERVLIVDWDVHHGNGTMHSFYDSSRVLYMSVHQYPHYPGTGRVEEIGRGEGRGYTVNVPLPGGQEDRDYLAVFREVFVPIGREYRPQLILVSAGFDTHRNDPLAGMRVQSPCFARMTALLRELAAESCPGALAVMLEGGYDPEALGQGAAAVLEALLGAGPGTAAPGAVKVPQSRVPADQGLPGEATARVIGAVRQALSPFWSSI